jgi:hypothetical protein
MNFDNDGFIISHEDVLKKSFPQPMENEIVVGDLYLIGHKDPVLSMDQSFDLINKQREQQKKEALAASKEASTLRLQEVVRKKMTTTMIGALDSFEKAFGYLWGQGKHFNELTDNQKDFRDLWSETRNQVLNKSNAQLRNLLAETSEYTVLWEGKHIDFKLVDKNNDN